MKRPSTLYALAGILWLNAGPGAAVAGAQQVASKEPVSLKSSPVQVELQNDSGSIEFFATGWPSALKIHGKGPGPDGTLTLTDTKASGSFTVDLEALKTGIALRDRHMKEEYLQVDRYPRAVLTISRLDVALVPDGPAFGAVTVPFEGSLLLHGVEKPVTGQAKVSRSDSKVTVNAGFTITLGEFGIEVPKYLGITVAEKVDVKAAFSAVLERSRDVAER
jgi:polyisoprenoid-binding protein YceI